ncbi:hypothetical protein ABZ540_33705 [Nocardia xishanensis]|uniref:hypothetical protein n=1 Tax=Nocardia xishanensis TaxID=238964 RepID=UPI0033F9C500
MLLNPLSYDTVNGSFAGRTGEDWWESVITEPGAPITLDALDELLTATGYRRHRDWCRRVTSPSRKLSFQRQDCLVSVA